MNWILLYPHSLLFKKALKSGMNLLYEIMNLILANGLDSLDCPEVAYWSVWERIIIIHEQVSTDVFLSANQFGLLTERHRT